jgi:hypothetical protein
MAVPVPPPTMCSRKSLLNASITAFPARIAGPITHQTYRCVQHASLLNGYPPLPLLRRALRHPPRYLRKSTSLSKAQLFAAHTQINTAANFRCAIEQNHRDESEPAAVCKSCYDQVQERADRLEAALHIDLKEAAQIVYDAVWADSSDPGKTYANAAQALLTELRKRAGVSTVLTTLQPYAN